ncbi:MAG TPA: protein kinase [Sandaracinaceae bacterium LLY-WYZ-13_1]|nr:protein kinase [Sandaracinaceae bacterium LLY-WYZ-13_1]
MSTRAAHDRRPGRPERAPAHPIGRLIDGRYRVLDLLGSGGSADIYRARDERRGGEVALERPRVNGSLAREAQRRCERAAGVSAALAHPNLVAVRQAGVERDGRPFLVMERLRGETLAERMDRWVFLSPQRIAELLAPVADALDALHEAGWLHRDIKPDNLFLTRDGVVKLIDLDLLTHADRDRCSLRGGVLDGTPEYAPPEVLDRTAPSVRGDVYALGAVAFELATGVPPFDGAYPLDVLEPKRERPAPRMAERSNLVFTEAFERAVAKALARDPGRRYPSAGAFARELARAAAPGAEPLSRPEDEAPCPPGTRRRRGTPHLAVAGLVVAGLCAAGASLGGDARAPKTVPAKPAVVAHAASAIPHAPVETTATGREAPPAPGSARAESSTSGAAGALPRPERRR